MKVLMRSLFIVVLIFSFIEITTGEESLNNAISLSSLNGLKHDIKGPLDEVVPPQFFVENTDSIINYDSDYFTYFTLPVNNNAVLSLRNPADDGLPYPVVISVSIDDTYYRNYIVNFDNYNSLLISFGEELKTIYEEYNDEYRQTFLLQNTQIDTLLNKSISRKQPEFQVTVFSSFQFDADLIKNQEVKSLLVTEPLVDLSVGILSYTGDDFLGCCLSTNGNKEEVLCIRDDTGAGYVMWIKINRYLIDDFPWYEYYSTLTSYYPTSSSSWHTPKTPYPECDYDTGWCISPMNYFYTRISLPSGVASHKWWNMHNIVYGSGSGRIQTLDGPNAGLTWTLWNN